MGWDGLEGGKGVGKVKRCEKGWKGVEWWKGWVWVGGGVEEVGGVERGKGVKKGEKGWNGGKGCVGGVLIHSSVQTARLCPSLPIPLFHQVQASCLSSLHLGEKGGRGGRGTG